MPLTAGTILGPYEIVAPLGAGGMGEVYRARDSRLGREVAIKVLPEHLSADPDVRNRFEREAKTISSLNHPNICTLFDVGRAPGETGSHAIDYLVMELVEGETLAQRIARGVLPVADVLKIGGQVADALDRAHRAGVVHRDLKPGNVMLTRSGAKLMDFGLARPISIGAVGGLTQSPTMSAPLTAEGTIVGTFEYMAPEQLEGREADARSDLWALGCVLYEMATGKRAFEGSSKASLFSAIMRDQPRAMIETSPLTPPALSRLVDALLAKNPDDRVQTAHDAKLQLQWIGESAKGSSEGPLAATSARLGWRRPAIVWSAAALSLALAAASWLLPRSGPVTGVGRARLLVPGPPADRLSPVATASAISPDGRLLAFVAVDSAGTSRLWLRPLDALAARSLPGTEHGADPFWAPNSRALGFFADGKLKTIRLADGTVQSLCDVVSPRGGTWGRQGLILFAPTPAGALFVVPEDGGAITEVARPDSAHGETALRYPEFLPDGRRFLFIALPMRVGGHPVYLGRVGSPDRKLVLQADAAPVFADPGWLVTMQRDRLVAQRLDLGRAAVTGKPMVLGDAPFVRGPDGTRAVSASQNGILAYAAGHESNTRVVWLDRSGRIEQEFALPAGRWEDVSVSPDGSRASLVRRHSAFEHELWLMDFASGQATKVGLQESNTATAPLWSPDGKRFVFLHQPRGPADLMIQTVDGGAPEVLYRSEAEFNNPMSWSPDGRVISIESPGRETGWDIWALPVDGDRKPTALVRSQFNEGGGWFSPDGRWLAYYSDETGGDQIYVQPYPARGARSVVPGSASRSGPAGGFWWSHDSREIVFDMGVGSIRAAAVEPGPTFRCGPSHVLFEMGDNILAVWPAPDHRRFLAVVRAEPMTAPAIVVDLDWPAGLRQP